MVYDSLDPSLMSIFLATSLAMKLRHRRVLFIWVTSKLKLTM